MIEVEEISDRRKIPEIEERWEQLRRRCGCIAPYMHFTWYAAALETTDRDMNPLVLFFKSSGLDVGLAPLVYRRSQRFGLSAYSVQFVSNPHTPCQRILCTDDLRVVLIGLFDYLKRRFGTLHALDLNELRLPEDEKSVFRQSDVLARVLVEWYEKASSRYVPLCGDFAQTLAALTTKTQKEFRRKIRRLESRGALRLMKITDESHISAHLKRFFELYGRTWKEPEPYPEFYQKICRKFTLSGALLFYALTLDEQPIAYLICLHEDGIVFGIKITYDMAYSTYSPGVVLVYKCIEDMSTIPEIREFDIGRGDEQFKREWTSLFHEQQRLIIRPNTALWRTAHVVEHYVLPVIKRHESLNSLFNRARRWITRE